MNDPTPEILAAVTRRRRYNAGEPIEDIYHLPDDWSDTQHGPAHARRLEMMQADAARLADLYVQELSKEPGRRRRPIPGR